MRQRFFVLIALVTAVRTGAAVPSVSVERCPPPEYAESRPAFLYFKKVTVTRKTPSTYAFEVVLQEPLSERAAKDLGERFQVSAEFALKPGARSLYSNTKDSMPLPALGFFIQRSPNGTSLEATKVDSGVRNGNMEGAIQSVSLTRDGFTFMMQANAFADNLTTNFELNSEALGRNSRGGGSMQKGVRINPETPGDRLETSDGTLISAAAPQTVAVDAQNTSQVTFTAPASPVGRQPNPFLHGGATMIPGQGSMPYGPPGKMFSVLKRVVIVHRLGALDLDVTMQGDLPAFAQSLQGLRLAFLFDFAVAPLGGGRKGPASAMLTLALPPNKDKEIWRGGSLPNRSITVSNFALKKDGLSVQVSSPLFGEDGQIQVQITPTILTLEATTNLNMPMLMAEYSGGPSTGLIPVPLVTSNAPATPALAEAEPTPAPIPSPTSPPARLEGRPPYVYYKTITATRDGKDAYKFTVTLDGDLLDAGPSEKGAQYSMDAIFEGPSSNAPYKVNRGPLVMIKKEPGSHTLQIVANELKLRGKVPVNVQLLSTARDGFSFSVQSSYFADISPKFDFSSVLVKRQHLASSNSPIVPSGQSRIIIDPKEKNTWVAGSSEPVATPTPVPSLAPAPPAPGRVVYQSTPAPYGSFNGRNFATSNEGFLYFKRVVIDHTPGRLVFAVTLPQGLPDDLPKNLGLRYEFNLEFGGAGTPAKNADLHGNTTVVIERSLRAEKFEWSESRLKIHGRTVDFTVGSFAPTKEGFTITLDSPLFAEDVATSVTLSSFEALQLPGGAGTFQPGMRTDRISIPPAIADDAPSGLGSLVKP